MDAVDTNVTPSRWGGFKLLGLFAIAGGPVLVAMFMYMFGIGIPQGRTNQGELVLPPLDAAGLVGIDLASGQGAGWTLVTLGRGPCDQTCRDSLYKIQQVNIALGREAPRVRHMLLALDQTETELAELRQAYQALQVRQVSPDQVEAVFKSRADLPTSHYDIYVVDPLGNLMMHYRNDQSGYDLLDDLKKLLRISKIG